MWAISVYTVIWIDRCIDELIPTIVWFRSHFFLLKDPGIAWSAAFFVDNKFMVTNQIRMCRYMPTRLLDSFQGGTLSLNELWPFNLERETFLKHLQAYMLKNLLLYVRMQPNHKIVLSLQTRVDTIARCPEQIPKTLSVHWEHQPHTVRSLDLLEIWKYRLPLVDSNSSVTPSVTALWSYQRLPLCNWDVYYSLLAIPGRGEVKGTKCPRNRCSNFRGHMIGSAQ